MTIVKAAIFASVVLFTGAAASAQSSGSMQGMDMNGMNMPGMKMDNMMGMHAMAATVTAVDSKTGLVDVTAGGMALKLHFPPTSLANVKPGDAITLHLAFTKP
ncbi:MAG: hypothetical protein RB191_13765 [Terriglobia bacterium]|jgi:hypothetical protein|nr:hypothetical protein [Terriglobia bacterium]